MNTNWEILLFGGVRAELNQQSISIPFDKERNVASLLEIASELYPALRPFVGAVRVAVNHEYADLDDAVSTDDEIALIPPVCGG